MSLGNPVINPGPSLTSSTNTVLSLAAPSTSLLVTTFGADPTGTIDSTAAIQAAINAAQALNGGTVLLPQGTYLIGSSGTGLLISAPNVSLLGQGDQYVTNSGVQYPAATVLKWGGSAAASAAMIALTSPSGASLHAIFGCEVAGLLLDCQSLCGYGLALTSIKKSSFSQVYVLNPTAAAFYLTTLLNANLIDTDTQHNIFTQCVYDCVATTASKKAHGFWLTNAAPSSSTNGNSSFNTFIECLGVNDGLATNSSGICYKLDAADNNSFINCIGYRRSGTTVPSVQLNGNNPASDGNVFYHYSDTTALNAINILGNASLGSGYNPTQNTFIAVDSNNGVNYPTLDAGCRVGWVNTNNINQRPFLTGVVAAGLGNDPNALAQGANVVNEALRIYDASQDHVRWADGSGTPWGTNIDGSENFRFSRLAGSGNVVTGTLFVSANTTAPPTNGLATCGIGCSSTANLGIYFGNGAPTFSAAEGAIYSNTTGTAGARLYVNTSSGSGTTWTAATSP